MKNAVIVVLFLCVAAFAQSPLGLWYPLGVPDYAVTGAAAAMGGSGTAVADEFMGTALNPANAAMGDRAAFSGLVSFDMTNIADVNASGWLSGYAPKLLSLVIPIGRAGSLGFSMQNRYDANFNFYSDTTLEGSRSSNNFKSAAIELQRNGGLTSWQAGWAYRFTNGIGIGVAYQRLYFNLESRETFRSTFSYTVDNVADASGQPADPRVESQTSSVTDITKEMFASDGVRLGMQIPVHEKVTLGAAAEVTFYVDDNGNANYEHMGADTLITERKFSVSLPPSINFGASYRLDDRWLFAADASLTLWESYANSLPGRSAVNRETFGVSAGARFVPAANMLSSPYAERIAYSAGVRYSALPSGSSGAHEIGFALGAGLPIPNDGGVIDIVFDFGRRTDSRFSGYAENIIKLQLGINGGRSWFQRDASRDY